MSLVLDLALPADDVDETLRDAGWQQIESSLASFLCRLLTASDVPRARVGIGAQMVTVWEDTVAAVYDRGTYQSGPYVRGDQAQLGRLLRRVVWSQGADLMLTGSRRVFNRRDERHRINHAPLCLVPLPDCAPYFGSPGVDHYVKRVRAYANQRGAGGRGRCFLLRGPTGVGKGVLARNVARIIGDGTRTLKVDHDVANAMSTGDLTGLIQWLQPAILLVDDVDWTQWDNSHALGPFEAMRQLNGYLFCTMMDDDNKRTRRSTSGEHLPGMRPGRVDEVWRIKRPEPRVREKLLRHYLGRAGLRTVGDRLPQVVTATKGLTGAYIAEAALRLRVHGMRRWKTEINAVKAQAPSLPRKRRTTSRKKKAVAKTAVREAKTALQEAAS